MTKEQLHLLANHNISDDPLSRISNPLNDLLKKANELTIEDILFDVHAHCFTYENVPKGFMKGHPPRWTLPLLELGIKIWSRIHHLFTGEVGTFWAHFGRQRIVETMAKGKTAYKLMDHHFNKYQHAFESNMGRAIPAMVHAELMMDMERGISGGVAKDFYSQLIELSHLRQQLLDREEERRQIGKKHRPRFVLPFLGLDPRNQNLFEDFLAVFSAIDKRNNFSNTNIPKDILPFFGVKIYPSLGYLPSDPKLMEIFEICEAMNIPVTTHCGSGTTRDSKDKVRGEFYVWDGIDNSPEHFSLMTFDEDFSNIKKRKKHGHMQDSLMLL